MTALCPSSLCSQVELQVWVQRQVWQVHIASAAAQPAVDVVHIAVDVVLPAPSFARWADVEFPEVLYRSVIFPVPDELATYELASLLQADVPVVDTPVPKVELVPDYNAADYPFPSVAQVLSELFVVEPTPPVDGLLHTLEWLSTTQVQAHKHEQQVATPQQDGVARELHY